jgi:hypothetical protein
MLKELELPHFTAPSGPVNFLDAVRQFHQFGASSVEFQTVASDGRTAVPSFINEFWTAGQRAADNLHEVSYRACFKPQLPRFFIERLTAPGDLVYDPFMGRGTTLLEAALLGRVPRGNDINPLSQMLIKPRLNPPALSDIAKRLAQIDWSREGDPRRDDLLVFYHAETLREISALKTYLIKRTLENTLDSIDEWIRMVALNRLTGHSSGFFSVYTLPPNQAVSIKSQLKINEQRNQTPPRRNVPVLILKKTRSLLKDLTSESVALFRGVSAPSLISTAPAANTPSIPSNCIRLVVTSPPFLDIVNYAGDNWLRCWFAGIDVDSVAITVPGELGVWQDHMTQVFIELHRVLRSGGYVAFEVGEVRGGTIRLEETVITCGLTAGLMPELVLINQQQFTKTANCWGVDNNRKGTNSNRIVVFRKN